jgi:hypothetical protein
VRPMFHERRLAKRSGVTPVASGCTVDDMVRT